MAAFKFTLLIRENLAMLLYIAMESHLAVVVQDSRPQVKDSQLFETSHLHQISLEGRGLKSLPKAPYKGKRTLIQFIHSKNGKVDSKFPSSF
jgi:hypothetical protein